MSGSSDIPQITPQTERIFPAFKILNVVLMAKELRRNGAGLLKGTSLNAETLVLAGQRITLGELAQVYKNAEALWGPNSAFDIGKRLGPANYGVYGYAIASSATLGAAFDVMITYPELATPAVKMKLDFNEAKGLAWIDFFDNLNDTTTQCFNLTSHLAMFQSFVSQIILQHHHFHEAWFTFPRPDNWQSYEAFFGFPCQFDMPKSSVFFSYDLLQSALREANSITAQSMRKLCEKHCQYVEPSRPMTRRVAAMMQQDLASASSLEAAAHELDISKRTLRRNLAHEGSSFRDLLASYRVKRALHLLIDMGWSADQIAHDLGYSSTVNFRTAFKSWTGLTVRNYSKISEISPK